MNTEHEKPAPIPENILPAIKRRWSPRAFLNQPVALATLRRLLEAARWAPSSGNEQPWRFVVGIKEQGPTWQQLFNLLDDGNQRWAGNSPLLMLSLAKKNFTLNNQPNRHALHDTGAATAYLLAQATEEGLFGHPMAGYHVEQVAKALQVPAEFDPVAMLAIGYVAKPDGLPPDLQQKENAPRTRKELKDFAWAGWEKPLSLGD